MSEETLWEHGGPAVASNYIIALDDEATTFVVCQPTLLIERDGNWGGLTSEEIAVYIKRNMLHAAPLPGRPLVTAEFKLGPGRR